MKMMDDIELKEAAIFNLEGTLLTVKDLFGGFLSDEIFTLNPLVFKELEAQKNAGRVIIIITSFAEKKRTIVAKKLEKIGILPERLVMAPEENHDSQGLKSFWVSELKESYLIMAAFDHEASSIKIFEKEGIPAYLVEEGKLVQQRGKAPKAGKGTGRPKKAPTKVVPVRLPIETIEKYEIDGTLLKKLVDKHIQELEETHAEPRKY